MEKKIFIELWGHQKEYIKKRDIIIVVARLCDFFKMAALTVLLKTYSIFRGIAELS